MPRSDTQVVCGKDAHACNGMVQKQLRSVGVPTWDDILEEMAQPCLQLNLAAIQQHMRDFGSLRRVRLCAVGFFLCSGTT